MQKIPDIYVDTLDYYHADCNFKATPNLRPKLLNSNRRFFEIPKTKEKFPFVDVSYKVPDHIRKKEYNLESLLNFVYQKGWPDGVKPEFVTHKQLLQFIASNREAMIVQVVRIDGIIFMYKWDEEAGPSTEYSWVFRHYLTKTYEDEPFELDGTIRKGVFRASIHMGKGKKRADVLYAGKIDAIDENDIHYETKTVSGGGLRVPYFWENQSVRMYWQSFFSNVSEIIFGSRTGRNPGDPKTRPPSNLPEYSVYRVEKMSLENLYYEAKNRLASFPDQKTFREGYYDLRNLFKLARNTVTRDGDGFIFTRKEGDSEWGIRRDDEEVEEFRGTILKYLPD